VVFMGSVVEKAIDGLSDALGDAEPIVGIVIVLAIVFIVALSVEQYFPGALLAAFGFIFIACLYCIKERAWK
jgi:hypothetical protein